MPDPNISRFKDSWIRRLVELQISKIRNQVTVGPREFIHPLSERFKKKNQQLKRLGVNYLGVFNLLPHGSGKKIKV